MRLGDMGARIIKIEIPGQGDDTRTFGPPFLEGESAYFLSINRNKQSLTLNMRSEKGKEVLTKLIRKCDVIIENFRPEWLTNYRTTTARLEFDRFYPELQIGLEYQGQQHNPKSRRANRSQIRRDEIKREICKESRVSLVPIWSHWDVTEQLLRGKMSGALMQQSKYHRHDAKGKWLAKMAAVIGQGEIVDYEPPIAFVPIEMTFMVGTKRRRA